MKTRALLALAALVVPGEVQADTITVSPAQSIQTAIDLLMINSDPTDTIRVAPGVYNEALDIDFSGTNQTGLTIVRDQNQRPIITGGILIDDTFRVTLSGLRVDSVHGDQAAAIRVRDSSAVAISVCSGFPGDDGGVDAQDCFEVVILSCDFLGMEETGGEGGYGVQIDGGCAHLLNNVGVAGNETYGIYIDADETELKKIIANGNGTGGILLDGLGNTLKSSEAKDNDGFGVNIIGVCDTKGCEINSNSGTGIRVGEESGATKHGGSLKNSTVKKNGGNGLVVKEEHRGFLVKGNTFTENGDSAIKLVGDANHITDNTVKKSDDDSDSGDGVLVTSTSSRNCIDQNTFKDNQGYAVRVEGDQNYVLANVGKSGDGFVNAGGIGNSGRANVTSGANSWP